MRRLAPLLGLAVLLGAGCASVPVEEIQPGERPAPETDEAGLWMMMDRAERHLQSSGRLLEDAALNDYVAGIVCRLAPEHCRDLRVYIVRRADFNASMAPNGTINLWTGLLLRSENEAQLAYILGHEIAHYQRRHTLQLWRDLRAKSDALAVLDTATSAVGMGFVGAIAELGVLGSVRAFSRDHEREADRLGLEMMVRAGYDGREAAKIWQLLVAERDAADQPEQMIFFSTHPDSEERSQSAAALAGAAGGEIGRERLAEATARFRADWLRDELRQRDFARLEVLLDHLAKAGAPAGELGFFRGELHRLRGNKEDLEKAAAAYEQALTAGGAPAETTRALGLVHWAAGENDAARAAFQRYLSENPAADDREMVAHYLQQID